MTSGVVLRSLIPAAGPEAGIGGHASVQSSAVISMFYRFH